MSEIFQRIAHMLMFDVLLIQIQRVSMLHIFRLIKWTKLFELFNKIWICIISILIIIQSLYKSFVQLICRCQLNYFCLMLIASIKTFIMFI